MANKRRIYRHKVEHDGLTFTRNSQNRQYSHVVLRPVSLARELAYAERGARWDWEHNQDWHRSLVDGTSRHLGPSQWDTTDQAKARKAAADAETIQGAREWLDGGLERLLERARERAVARWREIAPDRDESWCCMGWSSRLDLAQKLAKPGDLILEVARA